MRISASEGVRYGTEPPAGWGWRLLPSPAVQHHMQATAHLFKGSATADITVANRARSDGHKVDCPAMGEWRVLPHKTSGSTRPCCPKRTASICTWTRRMPLGPDSRDKLPPSRCLSEVDALQGVKSVDEHWCQL